MKHDHLYLSCSGKQAACQLTYLKFAFWQNDPETANYKFTFLSSYLFLYSPLVALVSIHHQTRRHCCCCRRLEDFDTTLESYFSCLHFFLIRVGISFPDLMTHPLAATQDHLYPTLFSQTVCFTNPLASSLCSLLCRPPWR